MPCTLQTEHMQLNNYVIKAGFNSIDQMEKPANQGLNQCGSNECLSIKCWPFYPIPSFGGGPAVNHLYMCAICQVEIEALAKRRKMEIDTFIKVNACILQVLTLNALCWMLNERDFLSAAEQRVSG